MDTLSCFTTGSINDITCIIGNGFMSMFGNGVFLSIFIIFGWLFLCFKLRLPIDLITVSTFALTFVLTMMFMPVWVKYLAIIIAMAITAYGIGKYFRR